MRTGDHVRVLKEGRWDHAIDCGDRTVIHFVAGARPAVCHTALADFARIGEPVEVVPHPERVHPAREVVARAWSRLGNPSFAHMFTGAEQFAVWCKSGLLPPAPLPAAPAAAGSRVRVRAAGRKRAGGARRGGAGKAPGAASRPGSHKGGRKGRKTVRGGGARRR